jgi:hypothetical protein
VACLSLITALLNAGYELTQQKLANRKSPGQDLVSTRTSNLLYFVMLQDPNTVHPHIPDLLLPERSSLKQVHIPRFARIMGIF